MIVVKMIKFCFETKFLLSTPTTKAECLFKYSAQAECERSAGHFGNVIVSTQQQTYGLGMTGARESAGSRMSDVRR